MKRCFSLDETTIADLDLALLRKQKPTKKIKGSETSSLQGGRHVKWNPESYDLIRPGKTTYTLAEIDALFHQGQVEESLFYIFRHQNQTMKRNETIPLYEAVYQCTDGSYIKAQKKHLTMAYRKAGRCRKAHMWDIQKDGTPMCVDRHCFSMMGQRESKKRYESQKKK